MDPNLGDTRLIIRTCERYGLLRNETAYVLGTTFWETAHTMEPVRETKADSDEAVAARLERAWKQGKLPWVRTPYWRTGYWGRGYVQLTHETNYARAGRELGIELVDEPFRALDPDIAVEVLVRGMKEGWFTGKKLSDYFSLQESNYRGARRIVNGTDKASAIAELARDYEAMLIAEGYGVEKPAVVANERRDGTQPREKMRESKTLRAVVRDWLGTLGLTGTSIMGWFLQQDQATQQTLYIAAAIIAASLILSGQGKMTVWAERAKKWLGGVR